MRKFVLISSLILLAGAGCSKVDTGQTDNSKADSAQNEATIQQEANLQEKSEVKNEAAETGTDSEDQKTEGGMNVQAEIKANTEVKASEGEKTEEPKEPAKSSSKNSETEKTDTNPTAPSSDKTTEEATVSVQQQVQSTKEFSITAKQWEFTPSTISVNKGDKVKLTVESIDVDHGFSISEFGVKRTLKPGQTETIEFTANQSGTFSFFCSVSCGSGHNSMKGTLIVK